MKCKLLVSYACSLKIYSLVNWSHGKMLSMLVASLYLGRFVGGRR